MISIAHYIRRRSDLLEDVLIITVLLHDAPEDYPELASRAFIADRFGERCARSIFLLNKNDESGRARNTQTVFDEIAVDEIASIVKAGDRFHNLSTMVGVFGPEKQIAYCDYAETYILPAMKRAGMTSQHFVSASGKRNVRRPHLRHDFSRETASHRCFADRLTVLMAAPRRSLTGKLRMGR